MSAWSMIIGSTDCLVDFRIDIFVGVRSVGLSAWSAATNRQLRQRSTACKVVHWQRMGELHHLEMTSCWLTMAGYIGDQSFSTGP